MKVVLLFKCTSKAIATIKVSQPSWPQTPFSNQNAFKRLLIALTVFMKSDLHFKAGDDHLFRKPRWIFQGCSCWQTHIKPVVFFNNFVLIMTIFCPTYYLRKHRGNWFVLLHFRVFPDPLWCTSATEQNWQNSVKYRLTFFSFNKKYAKKIAVGRDETI